LTDKASCFILYWQFSDSGEAMAKYLMLIHITCNTPLHKNFTTN